MGNTCCNDHQVVREQGYMQVAQSRKSLQKTRKNMTKYAGYEKYKQQNTKIIEGKNDKIEKLKLQVLNAQQRLQEKIKQQSQTKKDMGFHIRKIQNQIQSLKRRIQSEQKAIGNLREF